jgi:antitoxin HicB
MLASPLGRKAPENRRDSTVDFRLEASWLDPAPKMGHRLTMPTKTKTTTDAALRVKKIFVEHLQDHLAARKLSISRFAKETKTGRSAVQRLLDPKNTSISLHTMARTAAALDLELTLEVKPLPVSQLMKIVDQGLKATTGRQAVAIEAQFLAGYYGRTIKRPHAKTSKALSPA